MKFGIGAALIMMPQIDAFHVTVCLLKLWLEQILKYSDIHLLPFKSLKSLFKHFHYIKPYFSLYKGRLITYLQRFNVQFYLVLQTSP